MSRTIRPPAALAIVAIVAVLSAGCGGTSTAAPADTSSSSNSTTAGHTSTTSHTSTVTPREKAVKFSECMRANGVSAFPDPDASGALTIDAVANGSSVDTSSATFEQALSACRDLEPPGFTGHERSPQQQDAALKFAQCVREHGVKDFPDPATDDPLVDTRRIPSSGTPGGMSILNAAMRTCRSYAAAAGVKGP
jgi:hypothetical protein